MCGTKEVKQSILHSIANAEEEEIRDILNAIFRKQAELYPDYEMIVFSLPRYDKTERESALDNLKAFLMSRYGDT